MRSSRKNPSSYRVNRARSEEWDTYQQGRKFYRHLETALTHLSEARFDATGEYAGEIRDLLTVAINKVRAVQSRTEARRRR